MNLIFSNARQDEDQNKRELTCSSLMTMGDFEI